jgi:hypothetical protein
MGERLVSSRREESLMLRILAPVVLAAALAACQSTPIEPVQAHTAMLSELGLDPATVVHEDHVRYAIGSGAVRPTAFKSGLYVQTQTELYLFKHKEDGKTLEPDVSFPLEKLQYARLEPWGFTHLKQLQLGSPSGLIAVSFHDQPDAMAGDADKTEAAYAALVNAKVRAGSPSGRVWPEAAVKPYTEVYSATGAPAPKAAEEKPHH